MTSILTNNGAMTALATLRATNNNLESTQNEISTGKKVSSAKDNAAIWAVSKTMETDISAFKVISDSLGNAESTVSTAMAGSNRVSDLLSEMKDLAAGAMTDGADFGKFQEQIANKAKEIGSVINGTQMNGVNLLKAGGTAFQALASLDRTGAADGTTTANKITVANMDLNADTGITLADDGTLTNGFTAITDTATAATALGEIEAALEKVITKTATLGSAAENISSQKEFVGALTDSLKSGMGSLVDADMEEASAKLKALQTQQQLGVQSLSIANQAPGAIMSLFR